MDISAVESSTADSMEAVCYADRRVAPTTLVNPVKNLLGILIGWGGKVNWGESLSLSFTRQGIVVELKGWRGETVTIDEGGRW